MGIEGIDILKPDEFSPAPQVRERKVVSRHIVEQEEKKYVFGWDQPLQSFYLQVHDLNEENEDDRIKVWLGSTADNKMYEVEELVLVAHRHGLHIDQQMQTKLYGEKDDGV